MLARFGYSAWKLDAEDFRRGTPFRTFPYQDIVGLAKLAFAKGFRLLQPPAPLPAPPPPSPIPPGSPAAPSPFRRPPASPESLRRQLDLYDRARLLHLTGRYRDAIDHYLTILLEPLDPDLADSSHFFRGLALLRSERASEAVAAFDQALAAHPTSEWRRSVLFYRAEARRVLGDLRGAMTDLQTADIPPARLVLTGLGETP